MSPAILCLALVLLGPAPALQLSPFQKVLELFSPGDSALNRSAVSALIRRLEERVRCANVSCEKCLTPEILFTAVNQSSESRLDAAGFSAVSGGLLYYVQDTNATCMTVRQGKWVTSTLNMEGQAEEVTLKLIAAILPNYKARTQSGPCLNARNILNMTADPQQVSTEIQAAIVSTVLDGDCMTLLPPAEYFLQYVYGGEKTLNLTGLTTIMTTLKLLSPDDHVHEDAGDHDHVHEHDGDHDHNHNHVHEDDGSHDHNHDHVHEHDGDHDHNHDHVHEDDGDHDHNHDHVHEDDGDHDHNHDHAHEDDGDHDHNHTRRRRSLDGGDPRLVGHWNETCFSPQQILAIYGVNRNEEIHPEKFTQISSSLIQQQLTGICPKSHQHGTTDRPLTIAEKYIYGTIATLIVCLCALFGIAVLLCTSCTSAYQYVIQFFVSLAVGSLTGDAILHLIPQFLGLHSHSKHDGHSHDGAGEDRTYTWKLLVVLGGIYAFFLLEKFFSILMVEQDEEDDHADHGHCDHGMVLRNYHEEQKRKRLQKQTESESDLVSPDIEVQQSPRRAKSRGNPA